MTLQELVRKFQDAMNHGGSSLVSDGSFGPLSARESELYDFQVMAIKRPEPIGPIVGRNLDPAIKIIKEFEGFRSNAYLDPVNVPTIGWGTIMYPNGHAVHMGDTCTTAEASNYLLYDLQKFVTAVNHMVTRQISDNSFCALVSFCYNLGSGSLSGSTLLKKLNGGAPLGEVGLEFGKWVNAGGKPLPGLIRRRHDEMQLFLS